MNDWQPIETAPKDGTPILAYISIKKSSEKMDQFGIILSYDDFYDEWTEVHGEGVAIYHPTHWQPLPDPPK